MINPRHLPSLLALAEHGSFSAAADQVGRSHSAISLHIKALEDALGTVLVDRSARPVVLTPKGEALAQHARRLERIMEDIAATGQSARLAGRLTVGIVPTAMAHVAPPALARLKSSHPDLIIEIRTGLSGELAQSVQAGDLDAALLTGPDLPPEGLQLRRVASQPLAVIAPADYSEPSDQALIESHPFIWFSRKTWAGQQIERRLLDRRIRVRASMEIDSLEAIEALVRHGLGVAIVPLTTTPPADLKALPFGDPQMKRHLMLMSRPRVPKAPFIDALHLALLDQASGTSA